jgi:hypothetical protein
MKINLLFGNLNGVRSGVTNVDPFCSSPLENYIKGNVFDLDWLADHNECQEIIALDILPWVAAVETDKVLNNYLKKLAHGGRLTLSVPDFGEISRGFLAGKLSLEDVNYLLYGYANGHIKGAVFTINQLAEVLKNKGMKILLKKVENYFAVLIVERP